MVKTILVNMNFCEVCNARYVSLGAAERCESKDVLEPDFVSGDEIHLPFREVTAFGEIVTQEYLDIHGVTCERYFRYQPKTHLLQYRVEHNGRTRWVLGDDIIFATRR